MDAEGIRELFGDVLPVRVRRMFGGHGVYDGETMFALEIGGELYLKVDAQTQSLFEAARSTPFIYGRNGKAMAMSYWRLPDEALDDGDSLRLWTRRGLEASRRNAASKVADKARTVRRRASPPVPARPR